MGVRHTGSGSDLFQGGKTTKTEN